MATALSPGTANREILNEIKSEIQQISAPTDDDDYEVRRRRIIDMTHCLTFPKINDLNALLITKSFLEELNEFHPSESIVAERYFLLEKLNSMKNLLEHL